MEVCALKLHTRLQLGALVPVLLTTVVCVLVAGPLLPILRPEFQQSATALVLVLIGVTGLVSCGVFYGVSHRLLRRISRLEAAAADCSEGRLTQVTDANSQDEVSHICEVFNEMIAELRDYVRLLSEHSDVVDQLGEAKRSADLLRSTGVDISDGLVRLRRAQQQIIPLERARTLFHMFSGIAHRLNEGLMAILTAVEVELERGREPGADSKGTLVSIRDAAETLNNQVRGFLQFYRSPESTTEHVALDGLVAEAVKLTEPKWKDESEANGIAISVDNKCRTGVSIKGNRPDLMQVLTNLIFNAVEAMPDGGTITIESVVSADGNAVLTLTDTGTGMPESVRDRCLDPFFSTKAESAGLGLAIANGVLRQYGGRLGLMSQEGEGTTVLVEFVPLREVAPAPVAADDAADTPPVPRRILVVEDNKALADIVVRGLGLDGHTADVAYDGREGLEKFNAGDYDLVITDRAMPEMGGVELADAVKRAKPNTPVVLLTGFGETIAASRQKLPNIDMVIAKPVSLDKLRAMLPPLMGGGSGAEGPAAS